MMPRLKLIYAKLSEYNRIRNITANRLTYGILFGAVCVFAWTSGERLAYISAIVLFAVPAVSCLVTAATMFWLRVEQDVPERIVKCDNGAIALRLHNPAPLPFTRLECVLAANDFAVETEAGIDSNMRFSLGAMKKEEASIPFRILYRGEYQIGLRYIVATDYMGLFRLRRRYGTQRKILALPRIVDLSSMPLSLSLVAEASSRFDIRDEDYSVISDIRPYLPTDSIKRVHWKLTAKRNEWLVKMFQSNAQSHVSIIFDNLRLPIDEEQQIAIEDRMIENAVAFTRFCLNNGMPVDFFATDGNKSVAQNVAGFDTIYNLAGGLVFDTSPVLSPTSILAQVLNDATSNVNAIIFTTTLTTELFERVINATNRGSYTAIMYFSTDDPTEESEQVYKLIDEAGLACYRIGEEE